MSSRLSERLLERLPASIRRIDRRGEIVTVVEPDALLVVTEGALSVETSFRGAERQIVEVVSARGGLLHCGGAPAVGTATVIRTLMPTSFARLSATAVERLLGEDLECARLLALELCAQVGELRQRIAMLDEPDVRRRVLGSLQYLRIKVGSPCPIAPGCILPVPQSVFASLAGLSRQTVNRVLQDLQGLGLIRVERSMVCVLEESGIETLVQGERLPYTIEPCSACRLVDPAAPLACTQRVRHPLPMHH